MWNYFDDFFTMLQNVFSSKCRQRSMNPYGVKLIRPSAACGAAPGHQGDLNAAIIQRRGRGSGINTLLGPSALRPRLEGHSSRRLKLPLVFNDNKFSRSHQSHSASHTDAWKTCRRDFTGERHSFDRQMATVTRKIPLKIHPYIHIPRWRSDIQLTYIKKKSLHIY